MRHIRLLHFATTILLLLAVATPGRAQNARPPQPLVVEKIPTGFVVAPDFKATEVDGRFGQLAGGYAARVTDDTLLVGGAVYWLVNGSDDFKLAYGGLLLGWNGGHMGHLRFGARGLVGVGTATLARSLDGFVGPGGEREPAIRFGGRHRPAPAPTRVPLTSSTIRLRASDDFFVFEPQANAAFYMTESMAVTAAAGYRAVASTDGLRDVLDGPTVSLGLQFGW